ncbi:MAG: T9SS type A sorting domain-containing protein [Bacteroidota bacterium]
MKTDKLTLSDLGSLCQKLNHHIHQYAYQLAFLLLFFNIQMAGAQSTFFASSNTQQNIGVFEVNDNGTITSNTFRNVTSDADGIYYDEDNDVLYQLNRENGAVALYTNVKANLAIGETPDLTTMSAAETINGREIAVSGNRLVVAQDGNEANGNQNRLIVFDITSTSITLAARYDVNFNLWGIHADGETLYAIEDNSDRLAVFQNFFFLPEGPIFPTQVISVEGIVRTHGITYVADRDMMLLTDVGAASSPTDGAISVVMNYKTAAMDGVITADEQLTIAGDNTFLGNPVDIAFDADRPTIYVAERANGGGRILSYAIPATDGNFAPTQNIEFAGASAIHFPGTENFQPIMATRLAQLFVSSNTQQKVGVYNIWNDNSIAIDQFSNVAQDADGIYYDRDQDALYQLNRMNNSLNAYSNVNASLQQGVMPPLTATSSAEFINGREIAVMDDVVVVAQDANEANGQQNQLVWYRFSPTGFTFMDRLPVDFNLWGIHADGSTLYAIEDNSNRLAVFDDFFNQADADIQLPFSITVDGIIRTHGLTYVPENDMMILTDIGDASSDSDGAFVIVKDFQTASADGIISMDEQIRVAGNATFLGNPVDIAFEPAEMMIYVAERASGGGRVLGFAMPTISGNFSPTFNYPFAGASAVYLAPDNGMGGPNPPTTSVNDRFFVSSNTQRVIATYHAQPDNSIMKQEFVNANMDADGIFYDRAADRLFQVNRVGNSVNAYDGVDVALRQGRMPMLSLSSAAEFSNGRELAISGNLLVVAQDANDSNGNQNRLVIFDKNTLALRKKIDVSFNLWGIHAEGSDLYVLEDNSNRLKIYEDFFNQLDADIQIPLEVAVEGLVRTHGITYDAARDVMYLTDVGAASNADDGAIFVINNFQTASVDGTITMDEQIRIGGDATFLGNPVDIAYDGERAIIYVAERANGGGRVLGFDLPTSSGNLAPVYNDLHAGASAIYFADGNGTNLMPPVSEELDIRIATTTTPLATFELAVYPNPASQYLTVELKGAEKASQYQTRLGIYNNFGQQLITINPNFPNQTIDLSSLTNGQYYMTLIQDKEVVTKSFMKTGN